MNHLAIARRVFDVELAALRKVRSQLDTAFNTAVDTIVEALKKRGKLIVVGVGKSGNVGHKIAATLTSTGALTGLACLPSGADLALDPTALTCTGALAAGGTCQYGFIFVIVAINISYVRNALDFVTLTTLRSIGQAVGLG